MKNVNDNKDPRIMSANIKRESRVKFMQTTDERRSEGINENVLAATLMSVCEVVMFTFSLVIHL